jgi:hypothetical protein
MSDDYEAGSIAAANAIFAWLGKTYAPAIQHRAVAAWEAGEIAELVVQPATATNSSPVASILKDRVADRRGSSGTRELAFAQGYTGDSCDHCGAMKMKRTGTCLTCEACGTTTGCA